MILEFEIYLENTRWTRITWISPLCTAVSFFSSSPHPLGRVLGFFWCLCNKLVYELTSCRERPNLLQDTQKNPGTLPHISDFLSCFIKKKKIATHPQMFIVRLSNTIESLYRFLKSKSCFPSDPFQTTLNLLLTVCCVAFQTFKILI